uniref:DUF6804 family protein n=1 Tax=Roseivirga sp. TaxID=1964215 RepID=UPI00404828ED
MKNVENIIKVVLSILFLVCLLDMPYGYFQLVRFIGIVRAFSCTSCRQFSSHVDFTICE